MNDEKNEIDIKKKRLFLFFRNNKYDAIILYILVLLLIILLYFLDKYNLFFNSDMYYPLFSYPIGYFQLIQFWLILSFYFFIYKRNRNITYNHFIYSYFVTFILYFFIISYIYSDQENYLFIFILMTILATLFYYLIFKKFLNFNCIGPWIVPPQKWTQVKENNKKNIEIISILYTIRKLHEKNNKVLLEDIINIHFNITFNMIDSFIINAIKYNLISCNYEKFDNISNVKINLPFLYDDKNVPNLIKVLASDTNELLNEKNKESEVLQILKENIVLEIKKNQQINLKEFSNKFNIKLENLKLMIYELIGDGKIEAESINDKTIKITSNIDEFINILDKQFENWNVKDKSNKKIN